MLFCLLLLYFFSSHSLELYPLRTGIGKFVGYDSVFLAKKEIELVESDDSMVICDVIPIILKDYKEVNLVTNCLKNWTEDSKKDISLIINKDNCLYDNMPYAWDKIDAKSAKKRLNDYFMDNAKKKKPASNSIGYFLNGVEENLGCSVMSLLLEVKDEYDNNIELEGAALFQRQKAAGTIDYKTITNVISTDENISDCDQCLVFMSLGELFAMAITTGLPISIKKDLFLASSVDAQLNNQNIIATTSQESIRCADPVVAVAAWDIYDCEKFISMTILEKRAG